MRIPHLVAVSILALGRLAAADDDTSVGEPVELPHESGCTKPDTNGPPNVTIGDGRAVGPDVTVVPAHIDAVQLTSATWGVIPSAYLDSWLHYDGGTFLWKRTRSADEGGELAPAAVSWLGADDGDQELPSGRGGGTAVAMYTYTIKSSTEKTKKIKRFAEASIAAEAGAAWTNGSANAKVTASIDTESEFDHNISEKVDIKISIKCASYDVTTPEPTPAILYFGPDSVKRDLPLPIKDANGKPKTVKWNPIVVDAAFSADNGATNGNAVACWYKYKGEIEKGDVQNANWATKKGVGAEIGVTTGWRVWKFTADITVAGKAAGEWHDMDKTEFSKNATGIWVINGDKNWTFPAPPTEAQRDDFQKPCKNNADPVACAAWDNIKAAYMSTIMRVNGQDGATSDGPNAKMAEWQGSMLQGSFRQVGDWLDVTTFFELAELQQVGTNCDVVGRTIRVYQSSWASDDNYDIWGPIMGLSTARCSVVDMAKRIDTSTKVGRIENGVIDKANPDGGADWAWITKARWYCGHKDWDWDVTFPFPYQYFTRRLAKVVVDKFPKNARWPSTDYMCWGCLSVNGTTCKY